MPTDIAEIAESLRLDFGETARWRREKAAEHPEDSRNVEAAELLDRLTKTIKDVDPTLLDAYGSLWDDDVQDSEQHTDASAYWLSLLPPNSRRVRQTIHRGHDGWLMDSERADSR